MSSICTQLLGNNCLSHKAVQHLHAAALHRSQPIWSGLSNVLQARCTADMNDILEALKFGLNNSLRTAVMGAGHQFMGVQLLPNGLTIDTSNCTAVDVDPDSQTAYVQAGDLPFSTSEVS